MSTTTRTAAPIVTTADRLVIPASERRMPWDVMGGSLDVAAGLSVPQALAAHGLDYTVTMEGVQAYGTVKGGAHDGADWTTPADAFQSVIRHHADGTHQVLGVTGTRYTPIQNAEAFAPAQVLVDQFGATVTGAADFRGGGASLLVVDLAQPIILTRPDGGQDVTALNLLTKNHHDGNGALTFALTGMRLACTNAVQAAVAGAARTWKVSHTPNAASRVALAQEAILKAVTYRDAFQVAAQAMMDQAMTDAEFRKIVARTFPVHADDEGKAADAQRARREQVLGLYATSDTLEGIRGTRWAGYNAMTEWLDWCRPVRGGDVARAEGALEGAYVRRKAVAWETFAAV